jgi:hypothetical protein
MIRLDPSQASGILVTCTECDYWFSFRFDRIEAYRSGEDHAQRVHDVPAEVADNARRTYESRLRHAANS